MTDVPTEQPTSEVKVEIAEDFLPHDSEILVFSEVANKLAERYQHRVMVLEDFRKEATERFAEAGFDVDVQTWTSNVAGLYVFVFQWNGRLEGSFDPDRQVYEVTEDILGVDEPGVITPQGLRSRNKPY